MSELVKSVNKICGRLCVQMTGRLVSPLSVGSGEREYSDGDVVLNVRGEPYIPGSSLAGPMRKYSGTAAGGKAAIRLFGKPHDGDAGGRDDRQSRLFIYDAAIGPAETGIRDGVKLDENKTAVRMGKYNLQYIEPGAPLTLRFEIIEREDCLKQEKDIEKIWKEDIRWIRLWINGFNEGELRLGAKSRRGFGKIAIDCVRIKKFDMRNAASHREWLEWDWEAVDAFHGSGVEEVSMSGEQQKEQRRLEHVMEAYLEIPGALLVRTYAAAFTRTGNIPDYGQMTVGGKGNQATIPGSSWAGAFRGQIAKIVKELGRMKSWEAAQKTLNPLFGTWIDPQEKKQKLCASRLIFEETAVKGGHGLPTARIAIDRFTGGTAQGALYEEVPWAGGHVALRIRWEKDGKNPSDEEICGMLLWAIKDLQSGILAIGGGTSIGRGIVRPEREKNSLLLDGAPMEETQQQMYMQAAALWVRNAAKKHNPMEKQNAAKDQNAKEAGV